MAAVSVSSRHSARAGMRCRPRRLGGQADEASSTSSVADTLTATWKSRGQAEAVPPRGESPQARSSIQAVRSVTRRECSRRGTKAAAGVYPDRVVPAGQRLDPDQPAAVEGHQRLVVGLHLAVVDGRQDLGQREIFGNVPVEPDDPARGVRRTGAAVWRLGWRRGGPPCRVPSPVGSTGHGGCATGPPSRSRPIEPRLSSQNRHAC